MVAYHFPPEGSAGSYRPLRFVRELSKRGWGTSVVTAHSYAYERHDPELLKLVPKETQVFRVKPRRDPWQALRHGEDSEAAKSFRKARPKSPIGFRGPTPGRFVRPLEKRSKLWLLAITNRISQSHG